MGARSSLRLKTRAHVAVALCYSARRRGASSEHFLSTHDITSRCLWDCFICDTMNARTVSRLTHVAAGIYVFWCRRASQYVRHSQIFIHLPTAVAHRSRSVYSFSCNRTRQRIATLINRVALFSLYSRLLPLDVPVHGTRICRLFVFTLRTGTRRIPGQQT